MNDDEEVAIDGDQEPELQPGQIETAADDEGYDPDAEVEGKVEGESGQAPTVRAGRHPMSKQTRALLAQAVQQLQKDKAEGGDEDEGDFGGYDEPERPAPGDKRSPTTTGEPAVVVAPPVAPPMPDAETQKLREALTARGTELDARERSLTERETAERSRAAYAARPVEALREWMKAQGIAATDDEWKDEIADLVTDLSGQVLGVPLPSEIRNRIDAKRAYRAIKLERSSHERERAELERQRQEAQRESDRGRAHNALGKELAKEQHASAYPWLLAEDDPAAIILDVVEAAHQKDGSALTWTQAAQRANDYLEQQGRAYTEKRAHLLERISKPKNGQPQRLPGQRPQGPSQVIKTPPPPEPPAPAPQTPPKREPPTNPRNWNEMHRRNTKRMMRAAFKPDST